MPKSPQAAEVSREEREERRVGEEGDLSAEPLLVGDDPGFQSVHRFIQKSGASASSLLITGERGTGKTLVAGALHAKSPRSGELVVTIHCSIFTDPVKHKPTESKGTENGKGGVDWLQAQVEKAKGGALLLEEVGLLPLAVQEELLKILVAKGIEGSRSPQVDVRILSTSSGNLSDLVQKKLFRKDLFDRVAANSIQLPALREVPDNLSTLTALFLDRAGRAVGRSEQPSFDPKAVKLVRQYPWPGNVQELKQEVERLVSTCYKNRFGIHDLSDCIQFYKEPRLNGPHFTDLDKFQPQSFVPPII